MRLYAWDLMPRLQQLLTKTSVYALFQVSQMEVEAQALPQSVKSQCLNRVRTSRTELTKLRTQAVRSSISCLHSRIRCEHSTLSLFNRKPFMPPHLAPSFSVPVAPSACLTTRLMISRETNAPDYSRARRPFLIVRGGSRTRIELLLRRRTSAPIY